MKKPIFLSLLSAGLLCLALAVPVRAGELPQESPLPVSESSPSDPAPGDPPPPAPCSHSWSGWADSGDGHSRSCSACGAAESAAHSWSGGTVQAPTCTDAGSASYSCAGCGASYSETLAPSGHSFGAWSQSGDGHSRSCPCGVSESAAHSLDSGSITQAPTCIAAGVKTSSCAAGCGYSFSEPIPATGNCTFGPWTPTEGEAHTRSCSGCGKTESAGHAWGQGLVTVPPTCAEEGAIGYLCSGCGAVGVEILPKLTTHSYDHGCDPDCNVCGMTREVQHKINAYWSKKSSGHWHACAVCGGQFDFGAHYPGPAATEEKAQLCLTCGYTLTPKKNHTHKFSDTLLSNEEGHWYPCSGCEDQNAFQPHSYEDTCDPDCEDCGYIRPSAHVFDPVYQQDEEVHWSTCTLCGALSQREAHLPGPEATADKPQFCTVCARELAPAAAHIHESQDWYRDAENHWKECSCGERFQQESHQWDLGSENQDTTVTYRCLLCQEEKTEGTPRESMNFLLWILAAVLILLAAAITALIVVLRKSRTSFE